MTTPLSDADRRAFRIFMLIALVLLAAGIGLRDPWPSDEPRFTLVAKQMVESGNWLFPHRGHELYSDKPPMLMWMEAGAYELTRSWRLAFLLPSLLAGLLSLGLTYDLGRRLWNPRVGLFAAGALLTAFQFVYQVKRAQIDPLIMGYITLANWGLLVHCLRGPNWRAYWLGCFAAGLGVITKGVGVIALLMLLPYAFARMRRWDGVTITSGSTLRWLGGAVAFFAAIALWLVPMVLAAKANGSAEYAAYMNDILFRQTAKRYADSWAHPQPFWYYLPIVLFNWFPLSLAYPALIPAWIDALKKRDPRILLPLVWVLLTIVFFSIPRGKRDVYLMPSLPMLALAAGPYLESIVARRWFRIAAFSIALVGGIVIAGAGVWALLGHSGAALRAAGSRGLSGGGNALWSMVLAIGIVLLVAALATRPRRGVHGLLAGLAGLWLIWSLWAYPLLNDSSSAAGVMKRAGAIIGPNAELALVGWKEQNLLLADRPAMDFGFTTPWHEQYSQATRWQAEQPERRWIFSIEDVLDPCVDRNKAQLVGTANRREWWVYKVDAVTAGCVPDPTGEREDKEQQKEAL